MMVEKKSIVLGIVAGRNPYVEKFLQNLDKSGQYSKIVVICEGLKPVAVRNMVTVKQDIEKSYYSALREHKVNVLIHFGDIGCSHWKANGTQIESISDKLVNALIDSCDNSDIEHLIYISSSCVYSPVKSLWRTLGEEDLGNLNFENECEERLSEKKIEEYISENSQIGMTVLRPATILGPSSNVKYLVESNYWQRMSVINSYPIQFTHEYDFIDSLNVVLDTEATGTFNVASKGVVLPKEFSNIVERKIWSFPKALPFIAVNLIVRILTFHKLNYYEWSLFRHPIVLATSKVTDYFGFTPKFTSAEAVIDYLYSNEVRDMEVFISDGDMPADTHTEKGLGKWFLRIIRKM